MDGRVEPKEIGGQEMRKVLIVAVLALVVAFLIGCSSSGEETTTTEQNTGQADDNNTTVTDQTQEAPFYEGQNITLIVSTKPGGGYDTYGRLMARFMEKQMPGSSIVVKNVPGAGHIIGCNEIYSSEPNGLTFGTFNAALPLAQVVEREGVKFDLAKMSWLGSPTSQAYVWIMSTKSPLVSMDKILETQKEIIVASAGVGSQSHITPLMFAEAKGLDNLKVVTGYGGGEAELAMRRGEIDGQFGSWDSLKPFVENGYAVPVMFISEKAPAGYEDVPVIQEVITDPKWKSVVDTLLAVNVVARPFAGPPDIPEERLTILRDAFRNATQDPELMAMAEKLGRPIEYVAPDRALELVKGLLNMPESTVQKLKAASAGGED